MAKTEAKHTVALVAFTEKVRFTKPPLHAFEIATVDRLDKDNHPALVGAAFRYEDALLWATAPDLLDALRGLMAANGGGPKACGHDFTCVCAEDAARAALAKLETIL